METTGHMTIFLKPTYQTDLQTTSARATEDHTGTALLSKLHIYKYMNLVSCARPSYPKKSGV